jgi:hypothetical protein
MQERGVNAGEREGDEEIHDEQSSAAATKVVLDELGD